MLQGASDTALAADTMRSEARIGGGGDRGPRRLFADASGVLWTAELRRPRVPGLGGQSPAPVILFWSETRACLATLRSHQPIADLSEDDLRRHLQACLSG